MSNKQKHRWYDVIVAWANGEQIQVKSVRDELGWDDFIPAFKEDCPQWNDLDFEWRIKPKTVTKKYRMALVKPDQWRDNIIVVDVTNSSIDVLSNTIFGNLSVGDTVEVEIEE